MENLNLQQNWWTYIIYIMVALLGLSKGMRNDVIDKAVDIVTLIQTLGTFLKDGSFNRLLPTAKNKIIPLNVLPNTFGKLLEWINSFLAKGRTSLSIHAENIFRSIEPDSNARPLAIFGALIQLFFLLGFAYSDAIQLVNSYLVLFPGGSLNVPNFLKDLTPSLLLSSVGIAIAAGFILADFHGITQFGKWKLLKGKFGKVVYVLVWFSLACAIFIDGLVALSKIKSMPDILPLLDPGFLNFINVGAPIGALLIVVPMLLITLLFFEGLLGLNIIYAIIIWLLSLLIGLVNIIIIAVIFIILFGIPYIIEYVLRAFMWLTFVLTLSVGYLIMGGGITLVNVSKLIQTIINAIYFPIDGIISFIIKIIKDKFH